MSKVTIDVSNTECEEAIMCIRMIIRKSQLRKGDQLEIQSDSEPFWSLLQRFAHNLDHRVERWGTMSGKQWVATLTLQ